MPRGSTPVDISDLISDKTDLETRIARLKQKGKMFKDEIIEKIDDLDDVKYAEILESFMIDCKSLEDIAEDMGYSTRHIERLYSEAIHSVSV
jgi:DNA-directed RNA polymerase specialized sigma subunit